MSKQEYVDILFDATDPDDDLNDVDIEMILKDAQREHGEKFVQDLKRGMDIWHWGRQRWQPGDPLRSRNPNRVTKTGKMNKQDIERFKREIKDPVVRAHISKMRPLPESTMPTTSFSRLVTQVKAADWQGANQTFADVMQQKVADRIQQVRQVVFKEATDDRLVKCGKCKKGFRTAEEEPECKYCGASYEYIED